MLIPSRRLGPYEIVASLGAGGMGEVYRARDTRLGRDVAVKVLLEQFAGNPDRLARFEREAKAVAALSHPNILAIHDYGTEGTVTYAVMELLEGETLRGRLAKGPLPWREAVEIGAAVADGLAAAHAKGIVHRDLKPENLFLTGDGRVKILDFGLARIMQVANAQSETGPYVPAATDAGAVMGTVGYMSPEQVRGQPAEACSDIFSLGCVLYEMTAGQRAFRRDTAAETMTAILHDEPPDPPKSGMQVPADLSRLIRHCLAKRPNQRLQSARDLALGLRATVSDLRPHARAVRRVAPLIAAVLAALGFVGLIGMAVFLLTRAGTGPEDGKLAAEPKAIEALAVLPFVYNGDDPKMEMLSQTLAGHIIDSLGQMRRSDFEVRPFSSVARYTRQRPDNPAIGRALNVPLIVTGTLQQRGDDLTITVEVVDAREDNLLWSKPYPAKRGETLDLDLQDRIVREIAAGLGLQLSAEEERLLTRRRTVDPEAYRLYREAMYHLGKFTPEGLLAAIKSCKQALDKDPKYALAHAGLARCYVLRGSLYEGPKKTFPEARTHVAEALKLDPNLADAHSALAVIYLFHDWDWSGAERELKLAIALDPSVSLTWNFQGFSLAAKGRLSEALVSIRRGQELDPLTPGRRNELAMCYNWMHDYDQAMAEAQKSLELDPNFPLAYAELGLAYVGKGVPENAIAELEEAISRGQKHPGVLGMLGYAYAAAGRNADAQRALGDLIKFSQGRFGFAVPIARIHAGLGEKNEAFDWLQKACDEREPAVIWLKVDPAMDNLRSDPRFGQLLRDMGLPP